MRDQLNRIVPLKGVPKRIVSLVPSQTELLFDLGLGDALVGITKFCVHPSSLRKVTKIVGGTKNVNFKKIKELSPDIIICNKEENTEEIVALCSQISPVWVSDIYTIEDALEMIKMLGEIFLVSEKALGISSQINSKLGLFSEFIKDKPKMKVAYLIWKNPFMIAGRQTFINELLQLNHFQNIDVDPLSRYPEVELSDLKKADLVLLSTEPFPFKQSDVVELQNTLECKVLLVDGEYFSWYGSRLKDSFIYFKSLH
ncbi:ABC transporter substrate-binding protein [Ulvibacter antarcticus]|uniref:ABC-type Fe3+-hydroxamate transport system substrate-binding protein n=1 Tax=Ulvibacter antarcticus TaxID=442714 RepID=A0A3L9YTS4_9FLAO|nr:helical backbone metal receptor [Ulvibacter antarcticus]RMA57882.1 ABC-type Fe3+-hydroxamate transport system substrate-binding protein [Ulvibacter antarcticus]